MDGFSPTGRRRTPQSAARVMSLPKWTTPTRPEAVRLSLVENRSHLHIIHSPKVRWLLFVDGSPPQTRPPKPTPRRTDKPTHPESRLVEPVEYHSHLHTVQFCHRWFPFVDGLFPTDVPAEIQNPPSAGM